MGARARSFLAWLLFAVLGGVMFQAASAAPAEEAPTELALLGARVQTRIKGVTSAVQPASLPYHWDLVNGPVDGEATLWLDFKLTDTGQPLALYVPRLGNQFSITLNGRELAREGDVRAIHAYDTASQPHYFLLPASDLALANTLRIDLQVLGGRYGGLSRVYVGSPQSLQSSYAGRYFLELTGRRLLLALTTVLGLLGLLFAWRQRERAYLYYGLSELLWTVLTGRSWLDYAAWPAPWALLVFHLPLNLAPPLLWKFVLKVYGVRDSFITRTVDLLLVLAVPAALVATFTGWNWFVVFWQGLLVSATIGVAVRVASGLRLDSSWEKKLLAGALLLINLCAFRDYLLYRFSAQSYEVISLTRFAWGGIGVSFAWLIAERLRESTRSLAELNASLSRTLAARNAELEAAFARERLSEQQRGAAEERQRVMRDLHDGLGSHLLGTMAAAQSPGTPHAVVVEQLSQALDQLKMTVDALHETDGDLASLLGAVRYRLSTRLQAAGIELTWHVDSLPVIKGWTATQSYHLQMILFEVFSNMIRHSGTTSASLVATDEVRDGRHWIDIAVTDHGRGFDPDTLDHSRGKGMNGMRQRANSLNARLEISSRPGYTRVALSVPLDVPPAAGA